MRYPTISQSNCQTIAEQRVAGRDPAIETYVAWIGDDDDLDLGPLQRVAEQFGQELEGLAENVDKDLIEGQLSGNLFEALRLLPTEALDDRGFWRYLGVVLFWDFIVWREAKSFEGETYPKYVNGQSNTEAVLNRMFLRAKAVGADDLGLAAALPKATDFWRSHVIRVRTGSSPTLTRALVKRQKANRMVTGELRSYARVVNRTWTNVVLHTYTDDEARDLLDELHRSTSEEETGSV